jgi:hypothetical protein
MDILEWSLGLGGWISIVAFVCIAQTGNLDAVRYVLFIGVPIVAVSITYAVLSITWQLVVIVLWAITLMFRPDILFTVFTIGMLALISGTIHNVYIKFVEDDDTNDWMAPLRTVCKLGKLAYERALPPGFIIANFLQSLKQRFVPLEEPVIVPDAVPDAVTETATTEDVENDHED